MSIVVLGCAVLSASLLIWAQASHGTDGGYLWTNVASPRDPTAETAEIWQASASCQRPFFVKALLRTKARLKAYYDAVPEEVRARRSSAMIGEAVRPVSDRAGSYRVADAARDGYRRAAAEFDATLHAQYAEWYAAVAKLEIQQSKWQRRLLDVADQKVMLGEATRRSFEANAAGAAGLPAAKGAFEHYVLFLLGLGGFPTDEEQVIEADCVTVVPVQRVVAGAPSLADIWRWPLDHVAVVAFGLELVLIGVFFVPIALWIGTGDLRIARQHAGDEARRLLAALRTWHRTKVAALRTWHRTKFVLAVAGRLQATWLAVRRLLIAAGKLDLRALAASWNSRQAGGAPRRPANDNAAG